MLQSPVDKSVMIFLGTHGINWLGEDCGRKIKALNHGRTIKEFIFHPTERNWGLATAYTIAEDFGTDPYIKFKELYVTQDLGETWKLLKPYVVQFGWGVVDEEHIKAGIPKERILVSLEARGKGDQKHAGWNYKIDLIYSDDFFKTHRVIAHKGNKFMLAKDYLFVAQVVDQETQEVQLLGGSSKDKIYQVTPIETGQKNFKEHSYTFLDTSENSVFLHINHYGDASKYGHVYISDRDGIKYSQTLKFNVRSDDNQCDFEKINSLEGVFVANVISQNFMNTAIQELERLQMEKQSSMEEKHAAKPASDVNDYREFIKTLISFNKGGSWRRMTSPEKDSEGQSYDCEEYCYLNLHGISSEFPPFYSVDTAAGLIIGNGNVGRYLSHDEAEISTFLTRDGGLNWFEIKKGPHIYEIGDHGALIIIADVRNPTNKISYTWNEGISWEDLEISREKISIRNIIIEPTSTSQHFVVYGESTTKKGKKKGVAIGLDFSSLHEPQCRNPDNPDSSDSDYEKWTPNDGRAGKDCLLGRKVIYIRRKRDAACYNGQQFERKITVENCQCSDEDYECDVDYERAGPGEPCVATHKKNETEIHKPPAICHGYYEISKGYRKVPGDSCVNGVKYDPILIPCPYTGIFASLGVLFFVCIVVALVVLVVIAFNQNFFQNVVEIINQNMPKKESGGRGTANSYVDIVSYLIHH
jgi:hypothetical protein